MPVPCQLPLLKPRVIRDCTAARLEFLTTTGLSATSSHPPPVTVIVLATRGRLPLGASVATTPAPTFSAARFCADVKFTRPPLALSVRFARDELPALVDISSVPAETV